MVGEVAGVGGGLGVGEGRDEVGGEQEVKLLSAQCSTGLWVNINPGLLPKLEAPYTLA